MRNADTSFTIVTGATGSMGREAVRSLASRGESVIALCRDRARGEKMVDAVIHEFPEAEVELACVDLSSIASVKEFCESLRGRSIKGLFNNAGTLLRDFSLSADGLEMCVAVNYVAPFILCEAIGPMMPDGAHIVNMVSLTTRFPSIGRDFFEEKPEDYSQLGTYARSKLALMLYSVDFARRHPALHVNVSDPGVVNSNMIKMDRWFDPLADILFRPFCKSPAKGVSPALRALETDATGKLFIGNRVREIPAKYRGSSNLDWLLEETRRIVRLNATRIPHIPQPTNQGR